MNIAEKILTLFEIMNVKIYQERNKKTPSCPSPKEDFINIENNLVRSLKLAIDKPRIYFRIPVSKLLPYCELLGLVVCFYYINNFNVSDSQQAQDLKKYFFRSVFTNRFSSAVEFKLSNDVKIMEKIKIKID